MAMYIACLLFSATSLLQQICKNWSSGINSTSSGGKKITQISIRNHACRTQFYFRNRSLWIDTLFVRIEFFIQNGTAIWSTELSVWSKHIVFKWRSGVKSIKTTCQICEKFHKFRKTWISRITVWLWWILTVHQLDALMICLLYKPDGNLTQMSAPVFRWQMSESLPFFPYTPVSDVLSEVLHLMTN